jgi:hypothetical protein
MLDGIFADCYDRWGGRFSLLVPCVGGRIVEVYWPWLEAFDPDIVYSYVTLERARVLEIHERLNPAEYLFHRQHPIPRLDLHGFRPSYDFKPLSSMSMVFRIARYGSRAGPGQPVNVIDCWHTERPTRFLTDNFGTYHDSIGGGMFPTDARTAASLLTIVAPEAQADRRRGVPKDLNAIPNEMAAFAAFTEGRATSLSMMSLLFAPKLDLHHRRWSSAFNLVVGDSYADRVMFWNSRLLVPNWLGNDLCCLRISQADLGNAEFVQALGEFLRHRNHVNAGSGGPPQLVIRSCSLDAQRLDEACRIITETKQWSFVATELVDDLTDLVPDPRAIRAARDGLGGGFPQRTQGKEFTWSPPSARPPTTVPDHLADAPIRQSFNQGYWATDYILGHEGPGPHWSDGGRWQLSKRWRMAEAFRPTFAGTEGHGLPPRSRRSRDGNLTLFQKEDRSIEHITVPTVAAAMHHALVADGWRNNPKADDAHARPGPKVVWMEPSNESRYFTGILGMAGGLGAASAFLLHPFLKNTFARFGGSPNEPSDKLEPVVDQLKKRAQRSPTFDLRGERERLALAVMILKAARMLKAPMSYLRYGDLKAAWKAHRTAFWDANRQHAAADQSVDWNAMEEKSLDDCLVAMRKRQMIFQGHQWSCRNCHHKNWIDLGALKPTLVCEVCSTPSEAPVEIEWEFRPNGFLTESLRDHSVLSLIWTLTVLRDRARSSFLYSGPTWFGYSEDQNPSAEADLLVLSDGEAIVCEVKNSWRALRSSDINDLVALATRLRPDKAILAVMEKGEGPVVELAAARSQLEGQGIGFELVTVQSQDAYDDPNLPSPAYDEHV